MITYDNHEELAKFCCVPTDIAHICLQFVYYRTHYGVQEEEEDFGKPLPVRSTDTSKPYPEDIHEIDVGDDDGTQEEVDTDTYDPDGMLVPAEREETQYDYLLNLQDKVCDPIDDMYNTVSDFLADLTPNLRAQTIIRSEIVREGQENECMADFIECHSGVNVYGMERMTTLLQPVAKKYLLPMFQLLKWDNPYYLSEDANYSFHSYYTKNDGKHHVYYQVGAGINCTLQLLREFGYKVCENRFDLLGVCDGFNATLPKEQYDKWERLLRDYWAWSDAGCPDIKDRKPIFTHDN